MSRLNWGVIQNGGTFESLMHCILFATNPSTILFGRPGKDAGQDARSASGDTVYQAKYRSGPTHSEAVAVAKKELDAIRKYRDPKHPNYRHWKDATRWVLYTNAEKNPNDQAKWLKDVVAPFAAIGLQVELRDIEKIEGALVSLPQVESVYFESMNRVFVGLKEAADILRSEPVGGKGLDFPLIAREPELQAVTSFAAEPAAKFLPVLGPPAVGKSRFAFELLKMLATEQWRVLWALPASMEASNQWFQLLNDNQKTIVVLDSPNNFGVLRQLMEQVSLPNRSEWKVVLTSNWDRLPELRTYIQMRNAAEPVVLKSLNEGESKALLSQRLNDRFDEGWKYGISKLTGGFPGWLSLVADLADLGELSNLPSTTNEIASTYVNSCLKNAGLAASNNAKQILRWLALWGKMQIDDFGSDQPVVNFFTKNGIDVDEFKSILEQFVAIKLVRNWGVSKRLYAVQPVLVRQQVLGDWLLEQNDGGFQIASSGKTLLRNILDGNVIYLDSILETLSELFFVHLDPAETVGFMQPLFDELVALASQPDWQVQRKVHDLAEKIGPVDPDGVVDITCAIRTNKTEDQVEENPFWGTITHTHQSLVEKLPWLLFRVAKYAEEKPVAARILDEFYELGKLEGGEAVKPDSGKSVEALVKRLFSEARAIRLFADAGVVFVEDKMSDVEAWPFLGWLIEGLTAPVKETVSAESSWSVTFRRRAIVPDSPEWNAAMKVRKKVWESIASGLHKSVGPALIHASVNIHQAYHRAAGHEYMTEETKREYGKVLRDDLDRCHAILADKQTPTDLSDATALRGMWSWYVEHAREGDLKTAAIRCENSFNALSDWKVHNFFRFDHEAELAPETQRVATRFREASDPHEILGFFNEAWTYLKAARGPGGDRADGGRMRDLAGACVESLQSLTTVNANALTTFVLNTLQQPQLNPVAYGFVTIMLRLAIGQRKRTGESPKDSLTEIVGATNDPGRLLTGIYEHPHGSTIGDLTDAEFQIVRNYLNLIQPYGQIVLCGSFYFASRTDARKLATSLLKNVPDDKERSNFIFALIRDIRLVALRYDAEVHTDDIEWIVSLIEDLRADGRLLEFHDLEWLRDRCGFRMASTRFLQFVESRIKLETRERTDDDFRVFPSGFSASQWCNINPEDAASLEGLGNLCELLKNESFISVYWLPRFLADLDPDGVHLARFVEQELGGTPSERDIYRLAKLAENHETGSKSWRKIAEPVCTAALRLSRRDRERVYFGLSRKSTPALNSLPGEVPAYYSEQVEKVQSMLDSESSQSSLRPYFEWALRGAQETLKTEQGRAEEDFDA